MKLFLLACRLLRREGRSGELTLLSFALIIAVTSATTISLFSDRLETTMVSQAGQFLAGDLVVTSPTTLTSDWLSVANTLALKQTMTAEFSSVLMENNGFLLAGIKAVSDHYPLRGSLKITGNHFGQEKTVTHGPKPGQAWIDKRVLSALNLTLGESIHVGSKKLMLSKIITYEPDKRGNLYSLSPRLMMHTQDIPETGILKPGSHVHYYYQFTGQDSALKSFKQFSKKRLNPSQRIMDIHVDRPEIGTALDRVQKYLRLSSVIIILIAGVAIAITTRRYSERHFNSAAILRCLGCTQSQIVKLFITQLILLGFLASLLGCLLGWVSHAGLFALLKNLLPDTLASANPLAAFFGLITGMVILLGFALPPLLQLKKVSPLRILRRELDPIPSQSGLVYGMALLVISGLIYSFTLDIKFTLLLTLIASLGIALLMGLIYILLTVIKKLESHVNLNIRFALLSLVKNKKNTAAQILAFSLTLMAMLLSFSVHQNLLNDWQTQLPKTTPNHFVLNLFEHQRDDFQTDLTTHNISGQALFPIVRGRLIKINNQAVQKIVSKDSQGERAIHRDLSLTWSEQLPNGNIITSGNWHKNSHPYKVSIEQKLAASLNIQLRDELTFTIGHENINATVTSIRQVNWDSMKPNFYFIFSPDSLTPFPKTFITSFYLAPENKNTLNTLAKKYPAITILEVDFILNQLSLILKQLTQAINYLLVFALIAGLIVLAATINATLDERRHQSALLRTLGASRSLLRNNHLFEFAGLGVFASLFAVLLHDLASFALYHFILKITYVPSLTLWVFVPLIGTTIITLTGLWSIRKVVNKSPLSILREH